MKVIWDCLLGVIYAKVFTGWKMILIWVRILREMKVVKYLRDHKWSWYETNCWGNGYGILWGSPGEYGYDDYDMKCNACYVIWVSLQRGKFNDDTPRRKVGKEKNFAGDKLFMQKVVTTPINGWGGKSSEMIPSNDWNTWLWWGDLDSVMIPSNRWNTWHPLGISSISVMIPSNNWNT